MKILAIDPGTSHSAYCLYAPEVDVPKRILSADKVSNPELLDLCRAGALGADILVVEMIASYGMPVGKEVFETVLWSGRFIEATFGKCAAFELLFRREEKLHLCGSPRAKDTNIRQALVDKFGGKGTKKNPGPLYGFRSDMYAALAVAVTYAETRLK
jgi:hypothetical protein